MPTHDEIVARWRANAALAGVRLTDEDVARIAASSGTLERVAQVEAALARIDAWATTPDFLDKRLAEPEDDAHG